MNSTNLPQQTGPNCPLPVLCGEEPPGEDAWDFMAYFRLRFFPVLCLSSVALVAVLVRGREVP